MNVLIISYLFPPCGGGGVDRVHNFVKYLPHHHITPIVLTVEPDYYEEIYLDEKPLADYPPSVKIFRSKVPLGNYLKNKKKVILSAIKSPGNTSSRSGIMKKILKSLIIPDEQFTWIASGFQAASKIIETNKIDLILSTAPPFSAHVLAGLVARRHKIPLFLDYRDLWNANAFYQEKGFKRSFNKWLERQNLKIASQVLVTNEDAKKSLCSDFALDSKKVTVIENGFDHDSIQPYLNRIAQRSSVTPTEKSANRTMHLNYIGSLTVKRSPEFFLNALKQFIERYPQYSVQVNFIGFVDMLHQNTIRDAGLDGIVNCVGTVSKSEALQWMCEKSDVLLAFQRSAEGGSTAIPGKIYEYLSTGKPILTMDENRGATSRLLKQLGLDYTTEFEDTPAIFAQLERIIIDYNATQLAYESQRSHILKYDRQNLTRQLAGLIKQYEN